ncbi:putative lipoprotein [Azospirillum fermentarium]|uniref:imelysin family protein n=1 Tax=Azospirillum fermentarium TaxID=1233114 RepID=UPI0022270200|nr:imelysin family protein [Azospirillum fermentarium]MCW2245863.1 putative lipoprotein [Azospirillum fermentarium]
MSLPNTPPPRRRTAIRPLALSLAALTLAGALAAAPASARSVEEDKSFLDGLSRTHILPRIDALAAATADLATRLDGFCAAPDDAGLDKARAGFNGAMDAWMGAQHLRPGPLLLQLRNERIAFWPERRGIVARQLGQLLNGTTPVTADAIGKQSAAVQGLTALERLLWDTDVTPARFAGDNARRCAVATAIGHNVADVAGAVKTEWHDLTPALVRGEATSVGQNATDAVNNLFSSLVTASQIVTDQKLLAPMGANAGEAKPAVAESVRSGRTMRNVTQNLEAMGAMVAGENGGPGFVSLIPATAEGKAAAAATVAAFADAAKAAASVPAPFERTISEAKPRQAADAALKAVKAARDALTQKLPPLIGITLGFNELDGD